MKLKGLLILIIPVVVIALIMLIPSIPTMIPMQFNSSGEANWYIPKWLFPIVGVVPFLIYLRHRNKK